MPQSLSAISPHAGYIIHPRALEMNPPLAVKLASVIAHWAAVDLALGMLFAKLLHTKAAYGVAMSTALGVATGTQDHILDAAAQTVLDGQDHLLFGALRKISSGPRGKRNTLANGSWGFSPAIPEALLLLSTKASLLTTGRTAAAIGKHAEAVEKELAALGIRNIPKMESWVVIDPFEIDVYRAADFDSLIEEITRIRGYWTIFELMISHGPKFEHERQALYDELPIREALERVRSSRKKRRVDSF